MFFSRRATQAEYFDSPERSLDEITGFYDTLGRFNRLFRFAQPFQRVLPRLCASEAATDLSILDLGAGDGSLGRVLSAWAAKRGWNWRFTNLDFSYRALRLN